MGYLVALDPAGTLPKRVFLTAHVVGARRCLAHVALLNVFATGAHIVALLEFIRLIHIVGLGAASVPAPFVLIDLVFGHRCLAGAFGRVLTAHVLGCSTGSLAGRTSRLATFPPGFCRQLSVLRKAPPLRGNAFATFAPGLCGKRGVLREAPFLGGNALATLACDLSLLGLIHRRKAAIGRAFMLVISRHD